MSSTDPRLNGAAVEIELWETQGDGTRVKHVFQLTPMTDRDMTELDLWVRTTYLRAIEQSLSSDMKPDNRREILNIALDKMGSLTFLAGEGARMMGTIAGVTRLLWQSIKRSHPKVTEEELRRLMMDRGNIQEANAKWRGLNLHGEVTESLGKLNPVQESFKPHKKRHRHRGKKSTDA